MSRIPTPSEAVTTKKIPHHFLCPITQEIMTDPVICVDGHSYEKTAITTWFVTKHTSPVTNLRLENKSLTPNIALRESIKEFSEEASKHFSKKITQAQQVTAPSRTLPVSADAAVVAVAQEGDYPIHCAIRNNNLSILAAFSLSEDCLKQKNRDGKTPIELAAELGYWNLVVYIAKKFCLEEPHYSYDSCGYGNAMYIAAAHNKTHAFLALFNANARTHRSHGQEHCVHHVIRNKNIIILDVLLKSEGKNTSNLCTKNADGKTPIELAAELGHWDLVIFIAKRYTIQSDSDKDIKDGYANVLAFATSQNKADVITALLKAGASANRPLRLRQQAPIVAAARSNITFFPAADVVPSLARLKCYYLLEAGFFNASSTIFNTNDTAKVLETLRKRAKSKPGGTSEKTLEVFGLR